MAVIPGISLAAEDPHGFVQVLSDSGVQAQYHRFTTADLGFRTKKCEISKGDLLLQETLDL